MSRRDKILSTVSDLVTDFLYYDRKEDEEMPVGEIEQAIRDGEITAGEIADLFGDLIWEALSNLPENDSQPGE